MGSAGAAVADVLAAAGIQRLYTVPGESFLEVIDAVDRRVDMRLVSTRHESGAAFMAEGESKMTRRPTVAAATRGVGAANLAVGIHTARQDSSPVLFLLGQVETAYLGREAFQEVDLPAFLGPMTKWARTAHRCDRVPELVAEGLRVAQSGRPGPVVLALPADVGSGNVDEATVAEGRRRARARPAQPVADPRACAEIASALAEARAPVIVAGGGAAHARSALVAVAERFQAGVYASFRRQDVFPNTHPQYLGHLGLEATSGTLQALREADVVLVVGARLSEIATQGYELPQARSDVLHVDVDAEVIGAVARARLGLVADSRDALERLLDRAADVEVPRRDWSAARRRLERDAAIGPSRSRDGVDSAQVIGAMREVLPADTVVANDAGNFAAFLHRHWPYGPAPSQVAPTSGAMGYGLPAAIGAKLAAPDRTVVALAGDGGFLMTGQELETAVRYEVDLTLVVLRNGLHGTIAMHQARQLGRLSGTEIGAVDIAGFARSLGADAVTVRDEEDVAPALADAVARPIPSVVEVVTDPDVISPSARLSELGPDAG